MAQYIARNLLFIDSRLIEIGEHFESDLPPGRNWEPVDEEAKAAVAARKFAPEPKLPGDNTKPLIEIPAEWRQLDKVGTVRLARQLGAPNGTKYEPAVEWIAREEAARNVAVAA